MRRSHAFTTALCLALLAMVLGPWSAPTAGAHGLAGKRFFPATLVIDDPFVADELSLPSILHIKRPKSGDEPATVETEFSGELSKRITRDLGISLEGELTHIDPDEGPSLTGFGNLEVSLKYQVFKDDPHEAIVSLGLGWEVGGTGRKSTDADSFDTVSPLIFFGKGFGDLPESVGYLRPFALTGVVGAEIPTRSRSVVEGEVERHPNVLTWGFALEYSLIYLQSFVRDLGLPVPLNRMIPLVELDLSTPLDRGQAGKTTGTVNPGIIWSGRFVQLGLEAVFPVNERTGKNVGIRGMLHFYLDDLFPNTFGRPLFGGR
jgi:hypothetical protein